jgi:hypothetical protein
VLGKGFVAKISSQWLEILDKALYSFFSLLLSASSIAFCRFSISTSVLSRAGLSGRFAGGSGGVVGGD